MEGDVDSGAGLGREQDFKSFSRLASNQILVGASVVEPAENPGPRLAKTSYVLCRIRHCSSVTSLARTLPRGGDGRRVVYGQHDTKDCEAGPVNCDAADAAVIS